MLQSGLDVCITECFSRFNGQRIAIVCNQASIASDYVHALDHFLRAELDVARVFGPQHGIWGHTQDNMIEWEGYTDPRTGLVFHSLYGDHREPTDEMLQGMERLVFDVPDVGARYYTFVWTLANCMRACERRGIPVTVLDRPNPIGGTQVEGPVLKQGFESFVGLHPLPTRHGMTVGEVATHFRNAHYPGCDLEVVHIHGWDRKRYQDQTDLTWAMPSPNMPTVETAVVYPGQCLLEGTNLSEGRGTTRPFEIFGAPWVDAWRLTERLDRFKLPGVRFRPYQFQPTFQKFVGEVCQGAFIHVTDRTQFKPVLTTVAILQSVQELYPTESRWRLPPYEYEELKLPFDILAGNDWLRPAVTDLTALSQIEERMQDEAAAFEPQRRAALIY